MGKFEQIRDRLPTLYRPEALDESLLTGFLKGIGKSLEEYNRVASDVMKAHWFPFADRAQFSSFFNRTRQLQNLPTPDVKLKEDLDSLNAFPYIRDLARLAALLALPPLREPSILREVVEEYRLRIARIVKLYRDGLGTINAIRSIAEAYLPVDLSAPKPEHVDSPFWIEEFAPLRTETHHQPTPGTPVQTRGEPLDMVGPLMCWKLSNSGFEAAPPTIYIRGVEEQDGLIDATVNPVIELYKENGRFARTGIAYQDTVSAGKTLRLRPAHNSWIATDSGIQCAQSLPNKTAAADPTAPGPWEEVPEAPSASVTAILMTRDHNLWVATEDGGTIILWRFNGQAWEQILDDLSQINILAENGPELLIGTETGLHKMPLYPEEGDDFTAETIAGLETIAVSALFQTNDARWWVGANNGVFILNTDGTVEPFGLREDLGTSTAVHSIHQDKTGILFFGTALGVFQYQPGRERWYWYSGEERSEQAFDWRQFNPAAENPEKVNFPSEAEVFLPPVKSVYRGPDASLWLGTDKGIARYRARKVRGFTYETILEAFPDLTPGAVFDIQEDERGITWFCSDRGLFRYDGRDMWQYQSEKWEQLGRTDKLYVNSAAQVPDSLASREAWRFDRQTSQWQRFDPETNQWENFSGQIRSSEETAVRSIYWTDSISADLGEWDGLHFTSTELADAGNFRLRFKPLETRILDGGIPAIPRVPPGDSTWRYLSLETDDLIEPEPDKRPAWTPEGRLLPPPADIKPAPKEGRYDMSQFSPSEESEIVSLGDDFDKAVFAFNPAAKVWFEWQPRGPLSVLVRLKKRTADETIDPAIVERVWENLQKVRPAGVRTSLAVEENILEVS